MNTQDKETELLKTELIGLRIRLKRIEDFLKDMPLIDNYLPEDFVSDEELFELSKRVVAEHGKASVSLLQKALTIGYSQAVRLFDMLVEKGIVSPKDTSGPIIINKEKLDLNGES